MDVEQGTVFRLVTYNGNVTPTLPHGYWNIILFRTSDNPWALPPGVWERHSWRLSGLSSVEFPALTPDLPLIIQDR